MIVPGNGVSVWNAQILVFSMCQALSYGWGGGGGIPIPSSYTVKYFSVGPLLSLD